MQDRAVGTVPEEGRDPGEAAPSAQGTSRRERLSCEPSPVHTPGGGETSASVLKGGLGGTPASTAAGQASRATESVLRKASPLRVFYRLFRGLGKKEFRGGVPIRNRKLCSALET